MWIRWPFAQNKQPGLSDDDRKKIKEDLILVDAFETEPNYSVMGIHKSDIRELIREELAKLKDST